MNILAVDDGELALRGLENAIRAALPGDRVFAFDDPFDALECARERVNSDPIDAAFLDIEMGGMTGIELGKRLKLLDKAIGVIFVTAYDQYALESYSMGGNGYVLKPADKDMVLEQMARLREPMLHIKKKNAKLRVQCFGNFAVFHDGQPVQFSRREKAEELFAFLVHMEGVRCTIGEFFAKVRPDEVFEDEGGYFRVMLHYLRTLFRAMGAEDVLVCGRNHYAVNPDLLDCDYYAWKKGNDPAAVRAFNGQYMEQYSWAAARRADLMNRTQHDN